MFNKIIRHIRWRMNYALNIQIPQSVYAFLLDKKVYSGPFKGMNYIGGSTGSVILPKIIGTYEDELHEVLQVIQTKQYAKFLDIGAAEGYFAVGISKYILPLHTPTIAYEATEKGRRQIQELSERNHLNGIEIKGFCTKEMMYQDLVPNSLIWMDIEGGESELLVEPKPILATCSILVELHPNIVENICEVLINQLKQSHTIQEIQIRPKAFPKDVQIPSFLKGKESYLMKEFRAEQSWLWMQPK